MGRLVNFSSERQGEFVFILDILLYVLIFAVCLAGGFIIGVALILAWPVTLVFSIACLLLC